MNKSLTKEHGFTLIEIVISLGVFLVGFVSVISLFVGGFRTQDKARTRVTEAVIADNLLGALKEPEDPAIRSFLQDVAGEKKWDILESSHYPGYSYFFTVEPYGTGGTKRICTLYVFETKFAETLYEKEYSTLTEAEQADYDRNCIKCCTIIEKE